MWATPYFSMWDRDVKHTIKLLNETWMEVLIAFIKYLQAPFMICFEIKESV
jgi:hypothetical protein